MLTKIKVKLSKTEPGHTQTGLGFYQIEEDSLYFQVGQTTQTTRFFSYLESDQIRLDIGKNGCLLFVEITLPRRHWVVDQQLKAPNDAKPADIRFLDFRSQIKSPKITTNTDCSMVQICFGATEEAQWVSLAENLYVAIDNDNCLQTILLADIVDDRAGAEMIAFRKKLRKNSTSK